MQDSDALDHPVRTEGDFINFVRALRKDLEQDPDSWANPDLNGFLEALASHMAILRQGNSILAPESIDTNDTECWQLFADILYAAKIYE